MEEEKRSAGFTGVKFSCDDPFREIIIAELDDMGYNSMMETDEGVEGYIETDQFSENEIKELVEKYSDLTSITYEVEELESRNWNEEWEKNYEPIIVDDKCLVRATFHEPQGQYPYEIIINPRMSFGTGHHATTYLMLKNQMNIDHKGKRVLDAGCGTAILAVMASKLGASEVVAYDIDDWSFENAPENVALNQCQNIAVLQGTITTVELQGKFDIILANINKNVLLEEVGQYALRLSDHGILVMSGFYEADEQDLIDATGKYNLHLKDRLRRNGWSSLVFQA